MQSVHRPIIGGKEASCPHPIYNWYYHGMETKPGRGARRRHPKTELDLWVIHWTGGEGTAKGLFRVLNARKLGVEFAIDREGMIWQFADPIKVDTFDAGIVNPRSAGVEVVNYGFRRKRSDIPRKGRDRQLYKTRLNGRNRTFARFYPDQVAATIHLTEMICREIPTIPRCVPREKDGSLMTRTMTRQELKEYKGVIGHYHITKTKSDPGTEIFKALAAAGY